MEGYCKEGSSLSDVVFKKPHGVCSAVEILMFFFYVAKTLSDSIVVNVMERSTCVVVLGYEETNCTDPNQSTQNELQQRAAVILMARTMIETFIPSLLSLFIGPWSDTNGRRPLVLTCLGGYTISAVMWFGLSLVPRLHPLYFLVTSIPVALSGGYISLFLALYCYISDVTEFDKRAFRMGLLTAALLGGILISSIAVPYLLQISDQYGFSIVFVISALLLLLTYLYTYFIVKESVNVIASERTKLWRIDHVKEIFTTCFKSRPNHVRTIVMFIIINMMLFILILDGELSVLYMFMQRKFQMTLQDFTRFTSVIIVETGVAVVGCTWLFVSYLKFAELPLMFVGSLCLLSKEVLQAVAFSIIFFYVASVLAIMSVLVTPLSRALLSKLIPADDLGKIFAFIAFVEATAPLIASPLYTFVYKATLESYPNAMFWSSMGMSCVSVLLIGSALVLHKQSPPADSRPLLDDTVRQETSEQT